MTEEKKVNKIKKSFSLTPQIVRRLEQYMDEHYGCTYSEALHFILMEYFINEDKK